MTNDPADDQMMFDLDVDSHIPVTSEIVSAVTNLLFLTGKRDLDYEMLVNFLEPQTEDEKQVIREGLEKCDII